MRDDQFAKSNQAYFSGNWSNPVIGNHDVSILDPRFPCKQLLWETLVDSVQ